MPTKSAEPPPGTRRCDCGHVSDANLFWRDRYFCVVCVTRELERLEELTAALPRCWRLDKTGEPKLAQDIPVVPCRILYHITTYNQIARVIVYSVTDSGVYIMPPGNCVLYVECATCYDTLAAAEHAKAQGESDDSARLHLNTKKDNDT